MATGSVRSPPTTSTMDEVRRVERMTDQDALGVYAASLNRRGSQA